jgi:hypothetical protein
MEKTLRQTLQSKQGSETTLSKIRETTLGFQVTDLQVQGSYLVDRETTLQRKQDREKTFSFQV